MDAVWLFTQNVPIGLFVMIIKYIIVLADGIWLYEIFTVPIMCVTGLQILKWEKGGGGVVGSDVTCSSIFSLSIVSEIAPLIFFPFCVSQDVFS